MSIILRMRLPSWFGTFAFIYSNKMNNSSILRNWLQCLIAEVSTTITYFQWSRLNKRTGICIDERYTYVNTFHLYLHKLYILSNYWQILISSLHSNRQFLLLNFIGSYYGKCCPWKWIVSQFSSIPIWSLAVCDSCLLWNTFYHFIHKNTDWY